MLTSLKIRLGHAVSPRGCTLLGAPRPTARPYRLAYTSPRLIQRFFAVFLALIAAASPTLASSTNLVDDLAPRFFGGAASDRGACLALIARRPPRRDGTPLPIGRAEPSEEGLRVCVQLLSQALSRLQPDEAGNASTGQMRERQLLQTWRAIDRMKPWVARVAAHGEAPALLDAFDALDPLLRASVGIRHDERFHRAGDLQPFNDPTGRVFFGFAPHPVRAAAVSAGGGFEFEGAWRGAHRLPSGYRVFAESTVDLRRALRRRQSR